MGLPIGRNPNFPDNLDIKPSVAPNVHVRTILGSEAQISSVFDASSQERAIRKYGIAGRIWEAAYILNLYVNSPPGWTYDPPFLPDVSKHDRYTMIELGSGVGVVGAHIARHVLERGKDILIVTDLPEVCPLLEEKLEEFINPSIDGDVPGEPVALVRALSWGSDSDAQSIHSELLMSLQTSGGPRFLTHIICSDLVYFPDLLAPLLRSLIQLSSPPFVSSSDAETNGLTVIISYKIRSLAKETPFWSAFGLWFTFEPVLVKETAPKDESNLTNWRRFGESLEGPTFIFVARRRQQSFTWDVPPGDKDLLAGVGAYGRGSSQVDDTFESLLLMTLNDDDNDDNSIQS